MADFKIERDLEELARLYAIATGHNQQLMTETLKDAAKSPRSIFHYLNELVEKGAIKDAAFETELTEFYWKYC